MFTYDEKKLFAPGPCEPCEKPSFFGDHPRPYSMPERVADTARKLADTLARLQMFEENITNKYNELMGVMTQDNVLFKEVMEKGWGDFVSTVRSEINLFESNIEATLKLFENATNGQIAEQVERIEQAEAYMKANLNTTLENLLADMEASGELVGVIDSDVLISVKRFGAKGDGLTDDTTAIINALASLPGGGTVYFPGGVYLVSGDITVPSNITITGDTNSIVRRAATSEGTYNIFKVVGSDNVHFKQLRIEGERDAHTGVSGEWGMGISLTGASNCTVDNVTVVDCWGDGIYIGTNGADACNNVHIFDSRIHNNRRNGISVINVDGLIVSDCIITDNMGTAPQYGICFECNEDSETVRNASVIGCVFTGNKYGVGFSGSTNVYEVVVDGCTFNPANGVYVCRTIVEDIGGFIIIRNSVFKSALGVVFDAKTPAGIPVFIENCQFVCSNIPVRIGYPDLNIDEILGGITINNCLFAGWAASQYPIMIRPGTNSAAGYADIHINSRFMPVAHSMIFVSSPNTGSLYVDENSFIPKNITANTTIGGTGVFTRADINLASGDKTISLAESFPYGVDVTFRLVGSNAYSVTFACENGVFAQIGADATTVTVKGIYTTVTVRHEALNRWSIVKHSNEV